MIYLLMRLRRFRVRRALYRTGAEKFGWYPSDRR